MNNLEIVQHVLRLIEINEMEKANELIRLKTKEVKQTHVRGIRQEISEIVKVMTTIDIELMRFKLKKNYFERMCPDNTMTILNEYMLSLSNQRADLAKQKHNLAKSNR